MRQRAVHAAVAVGVPGSQLVRGVVDGFRLRRGASGFNENEGIGIGRRDIENEKPRGRPGVWKRGGDVGRGGDQQAFSKALAKAS